MLCLVLHLLIEQFPLNDFVGSNFHVDSRPGYAILTTYLLVLYKYSPDANLHSIRPSSTMINAKVFCMRFGEKLNRFTLIHQGIANQYRQIRYV